ncbi:hypothetical protein [Xylanibacter caecicola]|uniref:hypothetical protein n=1 Tax=Xylanibacter caecicola TaxID=2736294 RepID=UPI0025894E51|nr:hypothetical protein [Xylanibacter caecicola]
MIKKEDYIKPEITVISAEPLMPLAVSFTPDTDESEEDADNAAAKPTLPVFDIWEEEEM